MCEYARKLVAYLDHELSADEALALELHLQGCQRCREQMFEYRQVSATFNDYCAAMATAGTQRLKQRRVPLWTAAAAVLLLATLGAVIQRVPRQTLSPTNVPALASQVALPTQVTARPRSETLPTTTKSIHRRHRTRPALPATENWLPSEPSIQVAIPADAVFPPGAVPDGVSFTAVVNIGLDGSAQPVHFHQRMSGLEGSTKQP